MELVSQRKTYAEALVEQGALDKRIVALEADLGKSTMSCLFEAAYPDRFFEMGIAEANMVSTAAGLALGGKIPFAHSFAAFVSGRAFDQIRTSICIAGLRVVIVGSSAGLSDAGDGSTHQTVEDIATMRSLPNMKVLSPGDPIETKHMVKAVIQSEGPSYLRLTRSDMPILLDEKAPYRFGQMVKFKEEGDVALFSTGYMTHITLAAANALEKQGIKTKVFHVGCIKPLDIETLLAAVKNVKGIVTVEEHSVIGGLGAAIFEALSGKGVTLPSRQVGIMDQFGCSAHDHKELLEHYGLTEQRIMEKIRELLK